MGYLNAARELRIEKAWNQTLLFDNQNLLLWQLQHFVLFAKGLAFKYERSARENSWKACFKWVLRAVNKALFAVPCFEVRRVLTLADAEAEEVVAHIWSYGSSSLAAS